MGTLNLLLPYIFIAIIGTGSMGNWAKQATMIRYVSVSGEWITTEFRMEIIRFPYKPEF